MAIKPIFLDMSYVFALFNTRDQWLPAAVQWQAKLSAEDCPLLTTEFVLTEIGDGLSSARFRASCAKIIRTLRDSPTVRVIPASSELFDEGLNLFETRPDKDWGLTDCISFATMQAHELTGALTTDDHFRQAGFNALLLQ